VTSLKVCSPFDLPRNYFVFNCYSVSIRILKFYPFELSPFDPDEKPCFFTQSIVVGRAVIVNPMTFLALWCFPEHPEWFPGLPFLASASEHRK